MNSLFRQFSKYAALNILGMMGLSCYILADTFFVSKALGAVGLTALNLAIPVYNFIHGTGLMLGMGGATRYSILQAAESMDHGAPSHFSRTSRGSIVFTVAFRLTLICSAVFLCIGLFLAPFLARLLGADETTFEMTRIYLGILLLFSPLFLMNDLLLCFVRNDGAPGLAMAAMLSGSFANILMDYVFMFPMGLGIFGAVLATGFAPAISMTVLSPYFLKKRNGFHLLRRTTLPASKSHDHLHSVPGFPALARTIAASGLPSLVSEVSSGVVIIVFNLIILHLAGNIGVAAYGVVANLSLVVIAIYTGLAQGVQPLLSHNHGTDDHHAVAALFRYATITVLTLSFLIYGGLWLGAEGVAAIFNSEHNAQLQVMAVDGLRLYFIACPFAGMNLVLSVYMTSTDRTRPAGILSLLRGFILIIPLAFLMAALWNMTGLWLTFPVTELAVLIMGLGIFRFSSRYHPRPI